MKNKLKANGRYIIVELAEPEVDATKSALLLSPADLNPSLLYAKVLSTGDECLALYNNDFVYINKMNAIKLNHFNKDYYIVHENDIFACVVDDTWKEDVDQIV